MEIEDPEEAIAIATGKVFEAWLMSEAKRKGVELEVEHPIYFRLGLDSQS